MSMIETRSDLFAASRNWGTLLGWGILMLILGIMAIALSTFTTLISVIILGVLILVGGVVLVVDSFKFWRHKWSNFFLEIIIGILYFIVGVTLTFNPLSGAVSLTLLLAIFYIIIGLFRTIDAVSSQLPGWGWSFFTGVIALILGILILAHWPSSSLFIIGLFIGIDLIFVGWSFIMLGLGARRKALIN